MNRRSFLTFGPLVSAAVIAPGAVAAVYALTPRRIQDQVIDGALHLENCQNIVLTNCVFTLSHTSPYSILNR